MAGISSVGTFVKLDNTRIVWRKITIVGSYGAKACIAAQDNPQFILQSRGR